MSLKSEIKRKLFHHLSLVYLAAYAFLPRRVCLILFGVAILVLAVVEFLRIRRPEINAFFLSKFGGIHRESEILNASGIFWTLLGSGLTMLIFTNKKIVLASLGFLVFGDTAAALIGKKWGKHPWPSNPPKTYEGTAGFAFFSALWALCFVKWPVAIIGACASAWVESRAWMWNDNFWIPLVSGGILSVLNLVFGR